MAIGEVTSGTFSPTVQAGIAMARVKSEFAEESTQVFVDIRGRWRRPMSSRCHSIAMAFNTKEG